ncbi:hypothetical protein [Loktanella sp. R86503]|uniref:hypothetical protein n=1 Tax=Loktanella sp. R86503 TaxID=3093847 RepID=UPI0036DAB69B
MTETIPAMKARHRSELIAAITAQRDAGLTQTQAAHNLGVSITTINNAIHRNNVRWPVKRQGHPKHTRETAQ